MVGYFLVLLHEEEHGDGVTARSREVGSEAVEKRAHALGRRDLGNSSWQRFIEHRAVGQRRLVLSRPLAKSATSG